MHPLNKEGILKYFNNAPADYQKEFLFLHHRASYPSSIGQLITSEIEAATLLRLKASGTLTGAGFNGQLTPQGSIVVTTHVTMGQIELSAKTTVSANFDSSLGVSYNPLTGTMEVRIAKPTEELNLFKIKREILSPQETGPSDMNLENFDFPLAGFSMRFLSSGTHDFGNVYQNSLYALQYVPTDTTPIIFRGAFDPSNGMLVSFFAQSAQESTAEAYFNYRKSDSKLTISGRLLEKEIALEGQVGSKQFTGRLTQSNLVPAEMEFGEIALDVADLASDAENAAGHFKPTLVVGMGGEEYRMDQEVHFGQTGMVYESSVNAGQLGRYYFKTEFKKDFPQFEAGVYIGTKPTPDFYTAPVYGLRLGVDQNTNVNEGEFKIIFQKPFPKIDNKFRQKILNSERRRICICRHSYDWPR